MNARRAGLVPPRPGRNPVRGRAAYTPSRLRRWRVRPDGLATMEGLGDLAEHLRELLVDADALSEGNLAGLVCLDGLLRQLLEVA
ncbi:MULTISPECIES: hypothetical protein [Actinomadura]|uniref:Uncharacterized protein n=1 Tax=Actinomadura yumaensis TaxID=111807 RepID=A0ABW2CCL5_9ACTN|nr:hypothetical protein [Actinomadura sp. J1-007]MWK38413.1 hypothetical protein [Actinomadura sp. J1-007]